MFSILKAYDLYNYLLSLIVTITQEERLRVDIATQRANREGSEKPSTKFVNNKFALQLENNNTLNTFLENQKQTWKDDIEYVRRLCNMIEESVYYQDYMQSSDNTYEADRELWRKLYKVIIQENQDIDSILEEKSLYWNDDKEVVDTFVIKTIKKFDQVNGAEQELLPEFRDEDDKDFARKLFKASILNSDQYQSYMRNASRN